jgi:hypothetical protein
MAAEKAPQKDEPKRKAPRAYRVAHTMVDDWAEGTRLTADDLQDMDIDRLVAVGAIVPDAAADEPTAEPGEAVPPPSEPLPN